MLKKRAFACFLTLLCGLAEAQAQDRCIVADPTETPLNVRTAPNGRIVATLSNGTFVTIFERPSVSGGKWVYIARYEDRIPIGWVYRDYLDCQRTATHQPSPQSGLIFVPLQKEGGTYLVPVLINDAITLKFVVDSGAADVIIPADVVSTLLRTGTIDTPDFIGTQTYRLPDGSSLPSVKFRLRSLKVGTTFNEDVVAALAPAEGSLLLGQSFLTRFKSWSINNAKQALLLEPLGGELHLAPSLLRSSLGRWAVEGQSNCEVPSKAYSLGLDGEAVVWQDGLGNIDIETVLFSDENEFRTATVNSIHKSGRTHPVGTSWIYSKERN